jgi:hypothetical protein
MMPLVHGGLGACCGVLLRRRLPALIVAVVSHLLVDAINHEEPWDEDGNLRAGLLTFDALVLSLALAFVSVRRGVLSPESLGGVAGCVLDVEHLLCEQRRRPVLHGLLPHARWPSRELGILPQWAIGVVAWLSVLMSVPPRDTGVSTCRKDRQLLGAVGEHRA